MDEYSMFFATCPKGIEELLYQELVGLKVDGPKQTLAGVYFTGDILTAYRVCLWSRLANRVLMPLARFKAETTDALYDQVRSQVYERYEQRLAEANVEMREDIELVLDLATALPPVIGDAGQFEHRRHQVDALHPVTNHGAPATALWELHEQRNAHLLVVQGGAVVPATVIPELLSVI